jgi:hypothetical protein
MDSPELQFPFPADVLKRIRAILGPQATDLALRGLRRTAGFYDRVRGQKRSLSASQKQLARLATVLGRVQVFSNTLSPDALYTLCHTYDLKALEAHKPFARGDEALRVAMLACDRALHLVQIARRGPRNKPKALLAVGIAGALSNAHQPLSKGADGLFARVLTEVWHAVDPPAVRRT